MEYLFFWKEKIEEKPATTVDALSQYVRSFSEVLKRYIWLKFKKKDLFNS